MKKIISLTLITLCTLFTSTIVLQNSQLFAQATDVITGKKDIAQIKKLLSGDDPIIWVFTGDSITHGCHHLHGWKNYPEVCEERIRWELGPKRHRDIFINTGISGHMTTHIVKDFNHRVKRWQPTIVSIKIGMNDGRKNSLKIEDYKKNLEKIVADIRKIKAIPVLQTTNTSKDGKDNSNLEAYMNATREIAKAKDIILVDNFAYWQQNKDEANKGWFNDAIHPNGKGQIEIARCFLNAIGIDNSKSNALSAKGK